MLNKQDPDRFLLDDEHDEVCENIARKIECDPNDDPADAFNIFPAYLAAESKFYPKSWR